MNDSTPKPRHGFSLVSVIVAAGMLGLLALGFASLFKGVFSNQQRAQSYAELTDFESLIRITLSTPKSCNDTVAGVQPAGALTYALDTGSSAITSLPMGASATVNLFVVGTPQSHFTVTEATFGPGTVLDSIVDGTTAIDVVLAQLKLKLRLRNSTLEVERSFPISLRVQRPGLVAAAGSGSILGCGNATQQITEWTNSGPAVLTSTGTSSTKGTTPVDQVAWRRIGDSMDIRWRFRQTSAGTAGSGTLLLQIPADAEIDLAKLPFTPGVANNFQAPVGRFMRFYMADHGNCVGTVYAYDRRRLQMHMLCNAHGAPGSMASGWFGVYGTLPGAGEIFLEATIPIQGWK